jgi:dolichol-phosphate mannosyltransferase
VGLAGDEAYYWLWSRHLDLGYFDHPPMVAWQIAAGTWLAGSGEFGVRLFAVLMSTVTLLLVYRVTAHYVRLTGGTDVSPEVSGLWAVAAVAAAPLYSMGGFLATPDVPMIFFWMLSVTLVLDVVHTPQVTRWLLLGAVLGLGMLAKYSFGVLPLSLLIVFLLNRRGRELLRTPGPWLAVLAAVVTLIPHVLWLARHEYSSLLFQLGHGLGGGGAERGFEQRFGGIIQYVAGQLGVLTPLLFVVFVAALVQAVRAVWRSFRAANGEDASGLITQILVVPAVLTLLLFGYASLFAKSQTNWPAAAWLTLAVFAGLVLARWSQGARAWRMFAWGAVGMAAAVSAYAHLEAAHPLVPYGSSVFDKLPEKPGLGPWVQSLRSGSEKKTAALVLADNYRSASLLAFYLPDRPRTDAPFESGSGSQFHFWPRTQSGEMAWYITRTENDERLAQIFDDMLAADTHVEQRVGVKISRLWAYYGHLKKAGDGR